MSIEAMFNHRAVLYRPSAGGQDANGFPTAAGFTTPATPSGLNAFPDQSWAGLLADTPLGEIQAATRIWFLDKGFTDIHERDILDITEGPIAPSRFRIVSVTKPAKPRTISHVEVATHTYTGAIS